MRKLILLASFLFILFTSCTKKKEINNTSLIGVWNFSKLVQTNGIVKVDGLQVEIYTATTANPVGTITFKTDGTYSTNLGYDYILTTGTPPSTTTNTIPYPQFPTAGTYTYDVATNKLSLNDGAFESTNDLIALTTSNLEMRAFVSTSQDLGGSIQESSNITTLYFTK